MRIQILTKTYEDVLKTDIVTLSLAYVEFRNHSYFDAEMPELWYAYADIAAHTTLSDALYIVSAIKTLNFAKIKDVNDTAVIVEI